MEVLVLTIAGFMLLIGGVAHMYTAMDELSGQSINSLPKEGLKTASLDFAITAVCYNQTAEKLEIHLKSLSKEARAVNETEFRIAVNNDAVPFANISISDDNWAAEGMIKVEAEKTLTEGLSYEVRVIYETLIREKRVKIDRFHIC